MAEEQVKEYTRHTKTGQVITVHAHQRTGADVASAAAALPGRPPVAAKVGKFAGGRSVPGVFVVSETPPPAPSGQDAKGQTKPEAEPDPDAEARDVEAKKLYGKDGEPVATAKKSAPVPIKKSAKSPNTDKVVASAARIVSDIVSLSG